jgi:hypothetical protein
MKQQKSLGVNQNHLKKYRDEIDKLERLLHRIKIKVDKCRSRYLWIGIVIGVILGYIIKWKT